MRHRWKCAGVAAALALGLGAHSSAARGAVIGPADLTDSSGAGTCLAQTCTVMSSRVPGERLKSAFRGEIVRWRVNVPEPHDLLVNDGPLRLQILKRTLNLPGFGVDEYEAVAESTAEAVESGEINAFDTSLTIRKGQFIGVAGTDDTEVLQGTAEGATFLRWDDALEPGMPGGVPDFAFTDVYPLVNARVVR